MGSNPINLFVRFLLEVTALVVLGYWGWLQSHGWMSILLSIIIPVGFALIWGIFNVPGDPSRSGKAPIVVPGIVRLIIELSFFTLASCVIFTSIDKMYGLLFLSITIIHYLISYDRIKWLLSSKN